MANFIKQLFAGALAVLTFSTAVSCTHLEVSDVPTKLDGVTNNENYEQPKNNVEDIFEIPNDNNTLETPEFPTETTPPKELFDNEINTSEEIAKYYSSREQIETIMDALGADRDIMYFKGIDGVSTTICKFEHKIDEPLKVAIHPRMSPEVAQICLEQLDYVMGLIRLVNPAYTFEVVEYDENTEYDLVYDNRDELGNGFANTTTGQFAEGLAFGVKATININEKAIFSNEGLNYEQQLQVVRHFATHETMHPVGFWDVYLSENNSELDATTLLQIFLNEIENGFRAANMTPNDFKNLIAVYAPPSQNLEADIEVYKQLVENYTQYYYRGIAQDHFQSNLLPATTVQDGNFSFSNIAYINYEPGMGYDEREKVDFDLQIKDGKYMFVAKTEDGKILETSNGNVRYLDINVGTQETPAYIPNAIAVMENFESQYIIADRIFDNQTPKGKFNMMLYNNGFSDILMDSLGVAADNYMEYSPLEEASETIK